MLDCLQSSLYQSLTGTKPKDVGRLKSNLIKSRLSQSRSRAGISHQYINLMIIKKVNPGKITNDAQVKHLTSDEHQMENQLESIKIC